MSFLFALLHLVSFASFDADAETAHPLQGATVVEQQRGGVEVSEVRIAKTQLMQRPQIDVCAGQACR